MKITVLKLRYVLTTSLCLLSMMTGALQAHADEVKPLNDKKQSTVLETVKTDMETAKPAEEEKPTGDVSLYIFSAYYSKGVELSRNSAVIQPSLTVGYKGFTANVWGNLDTGPYQTPADRTKKNTWTETDVNLSYCRTFGMVNLGAGYSYFAYNPPFDGAARPDDQQEVNATVGLNVLLNPTLTVYKLFDKGRRWYIQMGVSHIFEFSKVVSLRLAGTAAYMIGGDASYAAEARFDDHANQTPDKYNAFLDGVLTACIPVKVTDRITITPIASYAFPLGTDAKNYMKGNSLEMVANNGDRTSSIFFGGLIMSFSF